MDSIITYLVLYNQYLLKQINILLLFIAKQKSPYNFTQFNMII